MKTTLNKSGITVAIAAVLTAGSVQAASVLTPNGQTTDQSAAAVIINSSNAGANILEANDSNGERVLNIDSEGSLFVNLSGSETATRFIMQDARSGAFHSSGKVNNADNALMEDGNGVQFVVQQLDGEGNATGTLGAISEEGLSEFVNGVSITDPNGNGNTEEHNLGDKLDGDVSSPGETLNFGVQTSDGTSGFVDEGTMDSYIRKVSREELEEVLGEYSAPVTMAFDMPANVGQGHLLSSNYPNQMPTFDGLRMDVYNWNNHYYGPRLYNVGNTTKTVTIQTFASQVNENVTRYDQSIAPGGTLKADVNDIVLWTRHHAEVITTNVRIHNANGAGNDRWYELKWWAMPISGTNYKTQEAKRVFMSVQRLR